MDSVGGEACAALWGTEMGSHSAPLRFHSEPRLLRRLWHGSRPRAVRPRQAGASGGFSRVVRRVCGRAVPEEGHKGGKGAPRSWVLGLTNGGPVRRGWL